VQSRALAVFESGLQESEVIASDPTLSVTLLLLLPNDAMIWNVMPAPFGAVTKNLALLLPVEAVTEDGIATPTLSPLITVS
jgi:hypothetical protein